MGGFLAPWQRSSSAGTVLWQPPVLPFPVSGGNCPGEECLGVDVGCEHPARAAGWLRGNPGPAESFLP